MSLEGVREIEGFPDRRIRIFRCGDTVDSFAIITQRALVLIDTLVSRSSMEAVMSIVAPYVPGRQLLVVNTHGDWDHVWGNGLFSNGEGTWPAPIVAHDRIVERVSGAAAEELLSASRQREPGVYDTAEFVPPTITFREGLTIYGGDLTLRLIPTPGHTPDHLAVWVPEVRLLLAGDAAEMPFPLVSEESDLGALRRSLGLLADLYPDVTLYCHAPGYTDPALIGHNIDYFDELEQRVHEFLDAGSEHAEAALLVKPDTLEWPLEEAVPPDAGEEVFTEFYREAHANAIRCMVRWLQRA